MDIAVLLLVTVALALALCAGAWWLRDRARVAALISGAEKYLGSERTA